MALASSCHQKTLQMMMRTSQQFLLALIGILTIFLVQAQDQGQSEFISIDCGLPGNSSYTEKTIGINYISDAAFIDTGESKDVLAEYKIGLQQQFWTVRTFPRGTRNCYKINVNNGTKYLIRASFLYANYDGQNKPPVFDLHFGANFWRPVEIIDVNVAYHKEIIHVPSLDYIHICLVNIGSGTPFISTIELRTMENNIYASQSGSLSTFLRRYVGATNNLEYRYRDDAYDRVWLPYNDIDWSDLSTLSTISVDQNHYKPPEAVMKTAATPINTMSPLEVDWDSDDEKEQFYIFMHFFEVQDLAAGETRAFDIYTNGNRSYGPVVPSSKQTTTIFRKSALSGRKRYQVALYATENSTLAPILNAYEIYRVKEFSQSETDQSDVDAMINIKINIKSTYGVTRNWQGDPCAPVAYMWEGLNCSFDGSDSDHPRITSLNLSSSGLTGEIPFSISKLTALQYLDLSNNSLSGTLPDFLTQLRSLRVLNLGNNYNLRGPVPGELIDRSKRGSLSLNVEQNPNPCESASCNKTEDRKKKSSFLIPAIASLSGLVVLLLLVAAIFFGLKRRKPPVAEKVDVEPREPNITSLESIRRKFSYTDLVNITNNFNRILGRGGFGTVYHGVIEGTQVAVKMLSPSSLQGYQQFVAEVKLLMTVHHRNLTSLVGYCNEKANTGLIYEYMTNGNLHEHLSGNINTTRFLTWEDRLRIALDSAQGLEYLHNGLQPPIIHRDVKSTNILLTENLQAKLADFGLSKRFPSDGDTHMSSTSIAGTPGYMDPEYHAFQRLTEKSDVYGFGVVLLEIITNQPAIARTPEKTHVSQWVRSMLSRGDINNIVDSNLQGEYDTNSVWKAVEIAMACVSPNSTKRPTMSNAVTELKECLQMELARTRNNCEDDNNYSSDLVTVNLSTEYTPLAR